MVDYIYSAGQPYNPLTRGQSSSSNSTTRERENVVMDQLKRPLLNEPQSPLTTIVEAEVEKSTASDDCVV